jgi:hypothetical protein
VVSLAAHASRALRAPPPRALLSALHLCALLALLGNTRAKLPKATA